MSASEELSRTKSSTQAPILTEAARLATILILFLVLHVVAGTILQRADAADGAFSEPEATSQYYD